MPLKTCVIVYAEMEGIYTIGEASFFLGCTFGGVNVPCIYLHARWSCQRWFRSLSLCWALLIPFIYSLFAMAAGKLPQLFLSFRLLSRESLACTTRRPEVHEWMWRAWIQNSCNIDLVLDCKIWRGKKKCILHINLWKLVIMCHFSLVLKSW